MTSACDERRPASAVVTARCRGSPRHAVTQAHGLQRRGSSARPRARHRERAAASLASPTDVHEEGDVELRGEGRSRAIHDAHATTSCSSRCARHDRALLAELPTPEPIRARVERLDYLLGRARRRRCASRSSPDRRRPHRPRRDGSTARFRNDVRGARRVPTSTGDRRTRRSQGRPLGDRRWPRRSPCRGNIGPDGCAAGARRRVRVASSPGAARLAAVEWFDELAEFLRIPSISADDTHKADVVRAAEWVCDFIRDAGGECEVVDWHGQPLAIGEIRASSERRQRADRPLLRALRRAAARPARAVGVAAVRARAARRLPLRPRLGRRQGAALHAARRRARAGAGGRAARQRALLLRRGGGDRRPLDRRVPRGGRARRGRRDHLRQRHDPARRARLQSRDARDGVLPRHAAHRRRATCTPACTAARR